MGKGSRDHYTLRLRKNTETVSKSFSMLTSTLRLQRITNALHYAAIENHEDVFQLLLEASIDISKRDYSEVTAFDYAFSSSIASVETNANKCLCQNFSTAHQVRNAISQSRFHHRLSFSSSFSPFKALGTRSIQARRRSDSWMQSQRITRPHEWWVARKSRCVLDLSKAFHKGFRIWMPS